MDSVYGDQVRYHLREDTSFESVFWLHTARSGNNPCLVSVFFMHSIVRWDLTTGDFGFASTNVASASTIYALWFGWLFSVAELEYCSNQWEEPCWLSGVVNDCLLADARSRERWMDYVSHCRVICGQEMKLLMSMIIRLGCF